MYQSRAALECACRRSWACTMCIICSIAKLAVPAAGTATSLKLTQQSTGKSDSDPVRRSIWLLAWLCLLSLVVFLVLRNTGPPPTVRESQTASLNEVPDPTGRADSHRAPRPASKRKERSDKLPPEVRKARKAEREKGRRVDKRAADATGPKGADIKGYFGGVSSVPLRVCVRVRVRVRTLCASAHAYTHAHEHVHAHAHAHAHARAQVFR